MSVDVSERVVLDGLCGSCNTDNVSDSTPMHSCGLGAQIVAVTRRLSLRPRHNSPRAGHEGGGVQHMIGHGISE